MDGESMVEKKKSNVLSLLVECEECGEKFTISSDKSGGNLQHKKEFYANGQLIFLTYYVCPKCNKRHFVQIDNRKTLNALRVERRMFVKMAGKKAKGERVPKKQLDKYRKLTDNLRNSRIELMKEFTEAIVHDSETDSYFELRFSV